jgi:hemerythrin-like domain-containing protein
VPTAIPVTPRRPGDPDANLLDITLAHRAMLADLSRLTELAGAVRDREVLCTPGRARAVSRYVELLCDSIRHHHAAEDVMLWPVIRASVGDHLDLSELTDDHGALAPRLDQLQARAAAFRLWRGSAQIAGLMAVELGELRALLGEHIHDEESAVFPLISAHVSAADWATAQAGARAGRRMSFDAPRELAMLTQDERSTQARRSGIGRRVLLTVLAVRHRRLDRAVFGRPPLSR